MQFRLHQKVTKSEQLESFFAEWKNYLIHVERIGREKQMVDAGLVNLSPQQNNGQDSKSNGRGFGKDVSAEITFNDEQKSQLSKLREEAMKAGGNSQY